MAFISTPDGDVKKVFLTDAWLLDQFVGSTLWSFGLNTNGQLGDNTITHRSSPIQTVSAGTSWKQVSCGTGTYVGAIKTDGTLWMWGVNTDGALGDNTITHRSSPVQTVAAGTTWQQVSCGGNFTGGIKTDGTLWMWGSNLYGQLGDNTVAHRSSPVQTVSTGTNWKQVACGGYLTAAIKTDGTLWTWGRNTNGILGDNTVTHRSSPVQTVAGGTTWKQVSCAVSVCAIKTDGTLWTWGTNNQGQLGDNTVVAKSSPVQTVTGGTTWKYCNTSGATVGTTMCGIKTNGTLWLWGSGGVGVLGDNTTAGKSSPVQTVTGGTNWKMATTGGAHTAAIKTDGSLWMWGQNADGKLGDNTVVNKSSPVQTVTAGTTWKQVSSGSSTTTGCTIAVKNG